MRCYLSFIYFLLLYHNQLKALSMPAGQNMAGKLSGVVFTENKGQVGDQHYKPRPDVLFSGSDGSLVFHLRKQGISYQLNRVDSWKNYDPQASAMGKPIREHNKVAANITVYRIEVNWLNSSLEPEVIKGRQLTGYNNYYNETCPAGALNVRSYEQVTYQQLYPGIDLVWHQ